MFETKTVINDSHNIQNRHHHHNNDINNNFFFNYQNSSEETLNGMSIVLAQQGVLGRICEYGSASDVQLVSWCFDRSQPLWIISGLKTNSPFSQLLCTQVI